MPCRKHRWTPVTNVDRFTLVTVKCTACGTETQITKSDTRGCRKLYREAQAAGADKQALSALIPHLFRY